jgi:hypothetical protein
VSGHGFSRAAAETYRNGFEPLPSTPESAIHFRSHEARIYFSQEVAFDMRTLVILVFVILVFSSALLLPHAQAQATNETLLSAENAYNPIPSPDGKYIAYVRTGWGKPGGSGGFGRSNLVSELSRWTRVAVLQREHRFVMSF